MMGGIVADLHARSTLPGLYAVGESSCTGLHGANRLASNSLSECFVFARRAVDHALGERQPARVAPDERELRRLGALPAPPRAERATREALSRGAGIVRTAAGLRPLLDSEHPLVRAIAGCALAREETRGAHARADFPERDPALDWRHAVVRAGGDDVRADASGDEIRADAIGDGDRATTSRPGANELALDWQTWH
jgi:L-aspartate oxidase